MENQGIELRGKLKRVEHEREVLLNCLRTIRAVAVDCDIRQLAEEGINYLRTERIRMKSDSQSEIGGAACSTDWLDLARKLERERDEWVAKTAELSSERDEARRLAEQFASGHDVIFYWENAEPEMNAESNNDVVGVASHTLFGRLLFVYALDGVVKCFSADEIRPLKSTMLDIGWSHTATIDPARWIEALVNGNVEPSDMLDELQFCPPREN